MIYKVLNRFSVLEYAARSDIPVSVIISITDMNSDFAQIPYNDSILAMLQLRFDDVEINDQNHMMLSHAYQIIDFLNEYRDRIDQIIVQCDGGISRSAGVCAALMKYDTGSDMQIFGNGRYCPNMTCYRTMLEALHTPIDEAELSEKEALNIRLWRKANELD